MTRPKSHAFTTAANFVAEIRSRRNQPTSEKGQMTIASSLLAVADALDDVADAIREGRSE